MKQFTFILITLSLFMSQSLHSQEVYNGLVKIKQNIAEVKNDSLYLEMDVILHGLNINSKESLVLSPILFHDNDSIKLPSIIVNGKRKQQKINRAKVLNGTYPPHESAFIVLPNKKLIVSTFTYRQTIPFAPWMKKAGLKLIGESTNMFDTKVFSQSDILSEELILTER